MVRGPGPPTQAELQRQLSGEKATKKARMTDQAETNQAAWSLDQLSQLEWTLSNLLNSPSGNIVGYRFTALWTVTHPGMSFDDAVVFESFLL